MSVKIQIKFLTLLYIFIWAMYWVIMSVFLYRELKEKIEELKKLEFPVTSNHSLFTGNAGCALWYFYLFKFTQDASFYDKGIEMLQINNLNCKTFTICNGYAGIGWMIIHLMENEFIIFDENIVSELDDYLGMKMQKTLKQDNWDYLHGASGILLYFLKRYDYNKSVRIYIEQYTQTMYENAIKEKNGFFKWPSTLIASENLTGYNIGMAHGMSSLLRVFEKIYRLKDSEILNQMISGLVQYILSEKLDEKKYGSCFPTWSQDSDSLIKKSRLGWCYGDLGISISLWFAGKTMNRPEWCEIGLDTLKYNATRKLEPDVRDAGICHGASGIAHIFNRMYQYTKIPEFKIATDYWLEQVLQMANFTDGLSGWKTFLPVEKGDWKNDWGFLSGVSGIGLVFLSILSGDEPCWDECLLLS